jgi:hypothetical protein
MNNPNRDLTDRVLSAILRLQMNGKTLDNGADLVPPPEGVSPARWLAMLKNKTRELEEKKDASSRHW